ncbi:prenyltransferase/squalene oxidase repeat-containing protein [Kitasatospora sp. NPDC006697]|uniref:prenyltransferase/squalene oxidase repeat-containing protein n=1 Tax=Kitasatospora sp. NPDC006697 TaxID=3364020 RepID=UPI00368FF2FB
MPAPARIGAALLSAGLLAGLAAAPAVADSASPSAAASAASSAPAPVTPPAAVFGKGDPTYDGVWRQSLSLLALHSAKAAVPPAAVEWLTAQQCADGGWPSYQAGTGCTAGAEDSNATAVAVQALAALGGHQAAVAKGADWLKSVQNADGSWAYNPGNPGDADSTGLALSALTAAGVDPKTVAKSGKDGLAALTALQLDCKATADQRGGLQYQPAADGAAPEANPLASAQSALALAGGALPVAAGTAQPAAPKALDCAGVTAGEGAAAYLVGALGANGGHLMLSTPGAPATPDYAATAWAALSLAKAGYTAQAAPAVDWLSANAGGWAKGKPATGTDAAATATLILAAEANGRTPLSFAGTDLVAQLLAAGPAAPAPAKAAAKKSSQPNIFLMLGVGLAIGIGYGVFLSRRKRSQ